MSEYTVMRAADAPDFTGDHPGAFLGYGRPMGAEQIAFNVRVLEPGMSHVPPGEDPAGGHSHATIEEIYFVLEGEVTLKLGDEDVTLGPRDAVLIPAATAACDAQPRRRHRGLRDGLGQGRRSAGGIDLPRGLLAVG